MTTRTASLTVAAAREALAALGVTIRNTGHGDFRVTLTLDRLADIHPGMSRADLITRAESLAYYAGDLLDAFDTGRALGLANRKYGADRA